MSGVRPSRVPGRYHPNVRWIRLRRRSGSAGPPWLGLGLSLALILGGAAIAHAAFARTSSGDFLTVAVIGVIGVVGFVAYSRLASAAPQLRTLRIMAILLPTLFIVYIEVILRLIEADDLLSEIGEHILAAVVLSLSAVPFSLWIFRSFATLRDQIESHAARLEKLHRASLGVAADPAVPRVYEAVVRGARGVVSSDRAVLLSRRASAEILFADPAMPDPSGQEIEQLRHAGPHATASGNGGTGVASLAVRAVGPEPSALLLERTSGPPFTGEEAILLDMFALAAAAGIVNAERLEDAQILATVEERERIARDLHDDLGQLLGYLTTKIQAVRELVLTDRTSLAADELLGLEEATRVLSTQVREAILGLRTSVAPGEPLAQILGSFTSEFAIQAGIRVSFTGAPDVGADLPTATRYQVVRIVQEAMSNARRHARAGEIDVELREDEGMMTLAVRDDGIGFDQAAVEGTGRFGLKTMAERARAVGGVLEVVSVLGAGTTVRASIPLGGV